MKEKLEDALKKKAGRKNFNEYSNYIVHQQVMAKPQKMLLHK